MKTNILIFLIFFSVKCFSQGLIINNTASFVLTSGSNIIISGNGRIYNVGARTFNVNSNVRFTGNAQQWIDGTGVITFGNVFLQNSSNGVALNINTNIHGTLNLQTGHFDLKNFIADLGTTGSVSGENESSRLRATSAGWAEGGGTGYISCVRDNPSGNVAGLGLNFTPSVALGNNTIIRRGFNALQGTGSYTSNYSIFRWYRIIPGSGTVNSITVNNFYYWGGVANAELNGHIESNLQMFQQVQYWNGSTNPIYWEPRTTNVFSGSDYVSSSTTSNAIMLNYILITLGSTTNPLPIELLTFNSICQQNYNLLTWQTASETNNVGFYVQKSNDGLEWENVGFVPSSGNSNSTQNYSFTDINPYYPITYYRLQQIDFDGQSTVSQIISAQCNIQQTNENFYPYTNDGQLQIVLQGISDSEYRILITNSIGQMLYSKAIRLTDNKEIIDVNTSLAAGIYYVSVLSEKWYMSKPVVIK